MPDSPALARQMWHLLEPLHAVVYFAPQVFDEMGSLGYPTEDRWPTYFPLRAAPLGRVGPKLVGATFYSFNPALFAEHLPSAWSVAAPEDVVQARLAAMDRAYRTLFGDTIDGTEMVEAATLARQAASAVETAGRPLAAANADLPWPAQPHLQLWHAATLLREARGDGHVAALLAAGLDPCEALVSFAAIGAAPVETFASRGWSQPQWAAARDRLLQRGWLDAAGNATADGHAARQDIERTTDFLAAGPWRALGQQGPGRLAELVLPLLHQVLESGWLPGQSTLGIGRAAA